MDQEARIPHRGWKEDRERNEAGKRARWRVSAGLRCSPVFCESMGAVKVLKSADLSRDL